MSEQSRTPDEKRFIRLIKILLGDVTIKLRQLFRSAYKEKYNKVWENDSTSGKFYMTMVPKPNKREKHMVQIVEQGNTDNFDNSVLFYCLLRSGTDLLLPGVRNKESRVSPFSQSERVDQLRALRNAVVHATAASITEADFNAMVKEIVVIYTELQWDQTQLKEAASGILWAEEYDKLRHQAEMDRARMDDFDQRLKDVEDTSRRSPGETHTHTHTHTHNDTHNTTNINLQVANVNHLHVSDASTLPRLDVGNRSPAAAVEANTSGTLLRELQEDTIPGVAPEQLQMSSEEDQDDLK